MIGSVVQAVIQTIVNAADGVLHLISAFFSAIWSAGLAVLDQLLAWLLQLVGLVLDFAVQLFCAFLTVLVGLLPAMPAQPSGTLAAISSALGLANRWFPVTEALALAAGWAAIYGAIALYKAIKLVRGGG